MEASIAVVFAVEACMAPDAIVAGVRNPPDHKEPAVSLLELPVRITRGFTSKRGADETAIRS